MTDEPILEDIQEPIPGAEPDNFVSICGECGARFISNVSFGNTVMEKKNHIDEQHPLPEND